MEPSGHRDRAEQLSKNRLAVLGAAYVGVLSGERGSPMREFNPCACSSSTASHPCTQKRVGAEASRDGIPPLLI